MKILSWKTKPSTTSSTITHELLFEHQKEILQDYRDIEAIREEVTKRLAQEIYPQVRSEILNSKSIEKIITDLRLRIASEVFKKEIK